MQAGDEFQRLWRRQWYVSSVRLATVGPRTWTFLSYSRRKCLRPPLRRFAAIMVHLRGGGVLTSMKIMGENRGIRCT